MENNMSILKEFREFAMKGNAHTVRQALKHKNKPEKNEHQRIIFLVLIYVYVT